MQPDAAADGSQKNGSRHDDPMAMCSLPSSYQHQNSRNLFSSSPEPATIARSNPFLRKPIWALDDVACDDETDRTASVASHSTATHLPSLPSVSDLVRTGERLDGDASPFLPSRVGQDLHADSKRQWSSRETLERHLSLFDLVSLGIGGTIGSGIFVLSGLVANQYAGPAVTLSWALAGVAATLSGVCYGRSFFPSAKSVCLPPSCSENMYFCRDAIKSGTGGSDTDCRFVLCLRLRCNWRAPGICCSCRSDSGICHIWRCRGEILG
mmetsp:Transcript_31635/g.72461  ORF Transcript_31635/g.72461 Transcript_31635/m.72461 type:complete len:267 (-) Transcript_31635:1656-2456(-)